MDEGVSQELPMSKYHSKITRVGDKKFHSKKEADRFVELTLMEKAQAIQDLKTQVAFPLIKKSAYGKEIKYVADFVYYEDGVMVVEDVKSPITKKNQVYVLKKRLMAELYGITLRET